MSTCATVYVVLGECPDLDRLEVCGRRSVWSLEAGQELDHCAEHQGQRGWVDADTGRRAAYAEQVAQFERQQATRVEQGALL
jgi:hypothetical protein